MILRRHRNRYVTTRSGDVSRSDEPPREPLADDTSTGGSGDAYVDTPVSDLAAALAGTDDVDAIRAARGRDKRKTARDAYDARLAELEG